MPRRSCSGSCLIARAITCGDEPGLPDCLTSRSTRSCLPIVGALLLLFVRDDEQNEARCIARRRARRVGAGVCRDACCSGRGSIRRRPEFQFVERHAWIPAFGISYAVGVDGISLLLLVLTGISDADRAPRFVGIGPQEDARRSACACCCSRAR